MEQGGGGRPPASAPGQTLASPTAYDFRRPDRIPKEQLRAIHLMHDFLARNLASSLGAYLRAYVSASLVSVEQLSFGEFLQYLPTPTCIASIGMTPLDGNSVLEINPSLAVPMLDILLGGAGDKVGGEPRELTEIEQSIAEGLLKVILHDLRETWAPVVEVAFEIEAMETQPQLMQILSANEAIVAIGFEVTLGESRGMVNFGVPSIMVKMMGQRFEQQWSTRKRSGAGKERRRMQDIARRIPVRFEARAPAARIHLHDLMALQVGDVVSLDAPIDQPSRMLVNGLEKFTGELVSVKGRRAVEIRASQGAAAR